MKITNALTDPRKHNPDDFIYIVSGMSIDVDKPKDIDLIGLKRRIERIKNPYMFYSGSLIGCLDEEATKRRLIHYQKVNQTGTFGDVGLILNPAEEDIYVAWNCDLGSPTETKSLNDFAIKNRGKIKTPFELLTKTVGPENLKCNELVLHGNPGREIQGVFVRGKRGIDKAASLAELVNMRENKDIPIIHLPEYSEDSYNKIVDPIEREEYRQLSFLQTQCEIMQASQEFRDFYKPKEGFERYFRQDRLNYGGLNLEERK